MEVKEWLDKVAYITDADYPGDTGKVYKSIFNDGYITRVGMEDHVVFLADRDITEDITHGLGFSPKDNKWYGWSHRAIYGFTIGSTCEKGDCHYVADTPEKLIEDRVSFFSDVRDEPMVDWEILPDRSGLRITNSPMVLPVAEGWEELADALEQELIDKLPEKEVFAGTSYIIKCGRGEWTAKTMEDAKQMAIDFNEGVS